MSVFNDDKHGDDSAKYPVRKCSCVYVLRDAQQLGPLRPTEHGLPVNDVILSIPLVRL